MLVLASLYNLDQVAVLNAEVRLKKQSNVPKHREAIQVILKFDPSVFNRKNNAYFFLGNDTG